ncbi:cytidine deaminase [Leadbetterella sp. DM7]|uniref:cytidine deaminase n=1 Tax=Leadbetterella sp. DM7 TaxID=3235085 RepID=UPI00349EC37C
MKTRTITLSYEEFEHTGELEPSFALLVEKAAEAAAKSYSPYSRFPVGAALLLDDGRIFSGNNQENLSYPAGTCAERTVLNFVKANFPESRIAALAVTAPGSTSAHPVTPCGICRQVITEMESLQTGPIRILLHKINGPTYLFESARALLPLAFEEAKLRK